MDGRVVAAIIVAAAGAAWGVWYAGRAFRLWRFFSAEASPAHTDTTKASTALIDVALTNTADSAPPNTLSPSQTGIDHQPAVDLQCLEAGHLPEASASVVVKEWARGRTCAMCRGPVTESCLAGHHIALLEPTGMTREWVDVGADRLALALATSLPLCWNCHVAATFRRTHPELVTDRDDRTVHVKQD